MASPGTQLTQSIPSDLARTSSGNSKTRLILLNLLLIAGTLALYAPVHHYPFVNYDDPWYVSENPYIKDGINGEMLHWAFMSRGYCHNWHPVTWISHALDIEMFGLNPAGHHDENVVLHALDAVLLFWVLRRATGYTGRSFMVAALFAVHPINVECVAWLSERKTMLSMIFFLLALEAYRWYVRKPGDGRYTLVALLYVLGLMAKPQVIALPVLLLLWDYWPLQRMFAQEPSSEPAPETFPPTSFWELVKEKIPLFVIAAGSALMTMLAQEVGNPQHWPYTFSIRLQNAIVSYARYVKDLFWPSRLAPFYPHPGNSLTAWQVASAFLLLLIITGLVFAGRRHRYLPMGWLWFLISLIPMIGLVQVWEQAMADRYAYQSFLGLFIIVCWGAAEWAGKHRIPSAVMPAVGLAVLLALSAVTHRQIGYWKDSVTLWSRSLEITPNNNFIGEQSMGYVLIKAGRRAEALPYLAKALAMRPADPLSNLEIGFEDEEEGNLPSAIKHYQNVVNSPESMLEEKRRAWVNMGHVYANQGDNEQARQCFQAASKLPNQ